MSESILAFIIGTVLMTPFVFGAYFIGRREGWTDGYSAGLDVSLEAVNTAKAVMLKFKADIDALILS